MNHLTFDELLKYAKRTIKEMHDEEGNLKIEYKNLIDKVNNHVYSCPKCYDMLMKLQKPVTIEEIKELRVQFEYKPSIQLEYKTDTFESPQVDNIKSHNAFEMANTIETNDNIPTELDGIQIDRERVKLYYDYPELLDMEGTILPTEKEAYLKAVEQYTRVLSERQNGAGKDKPKVLVKKEKNQIMVEEEQTQSGFINLLLLSLTTGFAGGIITAIMYGIIK